MKKHVLTFGILAGLISSVWFMTMMFSDKWKTMDDGTGILIGYATMLIAFSLIFVGIKNFRDKVNGGSITFGKAFLLGLYISLVASTVYVLIWQIEYRFFIPDFMEKYAERALEKMREAGKAAAEIEAERAKMKEFARMYKNPFFNALITYTEILPVGFIVSLIAAAVLKRKPEQMQEAHSQVES